MPDFPPVVTHELEGWLLLWADLEPQPSDAEHMAELRAAVTRRARARLELPTLSGDPTVAGLRRLYRTAGCDPTRYRPSSEALLRRLLKGEAMPAIHPLVDLNNCLSAELSVPVCVMDASRLAPPFTYRAGRPGEAMVSLRGPFNLEGKPLLVDTEGPVDTPITGGERVKVGSNTGRTWLVAYMPAGVVTSDQAREALEGLLDQAPVAVLRGTAVSGP